MHEVKPKKHIIGIELGTNSTRVARFNDAGRAEITNNSYGSPITPSVIHFETSGEVIVGDEAKKFLGIGIPNVFAEFKREMGTDKSWHLGNRLITPTELTAILLKKVVADYTEQYGEPDTIVITWPANYRNEQREATKEAAIRAGLKVEYFIEEPIATALYYTNIIPLSGKYLLYYFGGGTFDVTLIEAQGNDITVLYQDGVQQLGGKDLDNALLKIIGDKFRSKTGDEFDAIDCNFSKLDIESAKHTLSTRDKTQIRLVSGKHGPIAIDLSRDEFEIYIMDIVSQINLISKNILRYKEDNQYKNISKIQIDGIFVTGDSSETGILKKSIERLFGKKPIVKNPDEATALGAVIYAAINTQGLSGLRRAAVEGNTEAEKLSENDIALTTRYHFSFYVLPESRCSNQEIKIRKGARIPSSAENVYYLQNINQTNIIIGIIQSANEASSGYTIWEANFELPLECQVGHPVKINLAYNIDGCMRLKISTNNPDGRGLGQSYTADFRPI